MDKENNPEQDPTSQVAEVNIGNKDNREVEVTMDNENNPEQVSTCQVVEVNIGNEDHRDVEVTMDHGPWRCTPSTRTAGTWTSLWTTRT
jgi:hypothetical protein